MARNQSRTGIASLRLAVVSPFVDRRHGTERALAELLERLARDYHYEVHLYSQRVEDLTLASAGSMRPDRGAIFWHKVPSLPGPHLFQFLFWLFVNGFFRAWHRTVRRFSRDLLLSPGINCLHPDVAIVHALFHRLVEIEQEIGTPNRHRSGLLRRLHRRFYYRLLTFLERKIYADPRVSLAAVSTRTAGLLHTYFQRDHVRVIPNAVDASEFSAQARLAKRAEARLHWRLPDEEFVLLLIGNDWNAKGLPTVLEAMAALADLRVRLLVVGSDLREPFQALAAKLDVSSRCLWEAPRPNVLDFYAAADAYVSPSREDSFGLPVAEAMACGLPVITSSAAGVSDLVRDSVHGFVLRDPRDSQALAALLRRLATDAELRARMAEASPAAVSSWTWDKSAAELAQLLSHLHNELRRCEK